MKTALVRLLDLVGALAAAPLAGWVGAVGLNHAGLNAATAAGAGAAVAAGSAVLAVFWLWRQAPRGGTPVGAIVLLAGAAAGYGWLAWDARAPGPVDPSRLVPAPGQTRAPRELVLEASRDPKLGRAAQWPDFPAKPPEEGATTEWLHGHGTEIQAAWNLMAPARDWARQVSQFAVCDDYAERYESPVIDFRPLRELAAAHETYAEWLASEGRPDEAVRLLCDWIGFGRRLSAGGRSLVSMMFGVFVERRALTALSLIRQRGLLPDSARAEARQTLGQPVGDWANLQRVFLNEMAMFAHAVTPAKLKPAFLEGSPIQWLLLSPLLYNPNATIIEERAIIEARAAAAARGDLPALEQLDRQAATRLAHLYLKNPTGQLLLDTTTPATAKIAGIIQSLRDQRGQVLAELGG